MRQGEESVGGDVMTALRAVRDWLIGAPPVRERLYWRVEGAVVRVVVSLLVIAVVIGAGALAYVVGGGWLALGVGWLTFLCGTLGVTGPVLDAYEEAVGRRQGR